jgi:integrase
VAGSIRKRPDKGADAFELRVFLGRDANGRVQHRSRLIHGTQRAAERELARLITNQEAAPAIVANDASRPWGPATTINDAITGWKANGWDDLSPSTTRRYDSIWTTHIKNAIGRRKIASLSPYDVEVYFRSLKTAGLSEASVRQARAMLHRACRLARKWSGNELPNPIADTELPAWKVSEQTNDVRAPSIEEVRALLISAKSLGARIYAYMLLIAATGIRRGEACAIRWDDVNFENAVIQVDESIVMVEGGVLVKGPKSKAGIRRLAVDVATIESLRVLRDQCGALADVAELALTDRHFVFATEPPGDTPPYPDSMSHAFARIRDDAGVASDVHLHSLRHFQATALDAVISEAQKQARLGWSTVHMARHYTDVIDEEDRRAAEHMGCLLAGEESDEPHTGQTPSAGTAA